jgi:ABC-2 type transport system permease protein
VLTSLTFGWRALLKIKHVPEQLVDVTMFPIMFTLMFTYLFGGALAGSTQAYLQFLLPGILVQANVMITMNTGITLNTDIQKGVFDRFRSLPVWRPSPLVGALLGDVMRYSIGSAIVITLGLVLGFRPAGGAVGVVLSVALLLVFSFCLSWLWTMLSLILRSPNSVAGVSMMVMFPLTFVSNIFVDPKTMPGWMQAVVEVNPITHLATVVRGLMDGSVPAGEIGWVLVSSVLLVAVFGPITMVLYRNKT